MKYLIHSNGPNVSTGYGVQCRYLVERLRADGHDPAVSCNYGQQGGIGKWRETRLYPCGYDGNGNHLIAWNAAHWFGEDPGWLITLLDVWSLTNPLAGLNVAAWVPVDHLPVPPGVIEFFTRTNAVPVAMSRFGEQWLRDAGLDPTYIPLSVDTKVFKPTYSIDVEDRTINARELFDIPLEAFVVGMVAMNKGWSRDRKGFNEALRAFAKFRNNHPEAILYMHSEKFGLAEGVNLLELAKHAGIPESAVRWVDQYAYVLGVPPNMMAAAYTAMDVLLAPSHGEGFCVPLIEAQACGTPVIATAFSSQIELAGPEYGAAGWLVAGQAEWDPAQHASYVVPFTDGIVDALEDVYQTDLVGLQEKAIAFAARYDTDVVYDTYWRPFLATLEPPVQEVREPMGDIAVIVPFMRDDNSRRLINSFNATNDGSARLYLVHDNTSAWAGDATGIDTGKPHTTYAEKVNLGVQGTSGSFVCVVGDDVEFKDGWIEAARKVSERFDVIGTNDTDGPVKNPDVAAGRHADHFFVRRTYIDDIGASLDGPGVLAPDCYQHWWTDKEIIELAKARGVFTPCLDSVIVHHHPGYDGREDLREADPVYMAAMEHADADARTYRTRLPLIQMQRVSRAQ